MHISDGVLPLQELAAGGLGTVALAGGLLMRLDAQKIPRVAFCASFFFVASIVPIPIGPTSVHLLLVGLVGIIMGPWAFLPILFGLALQALLGYGGKTSLGVNALVMGLPAYPAYYLFRLEKRVRLRGSTFIFGFLAGAGAVAVALALLKFVLSMAGEEFIGVAWAVVVAYIPVAIVEGLVTGFAVSLLKKVNPQILEPSDA
ncbi:MAG: cobalt transporter CbiM [Planctomycetes bacterium]|nr:cobalt transporter CbiM [Planctomycetota bacterium]